MHVTHLELKLAKKKNIIEKEMEEKKGDGRQLSLSWNIFLVLFFLFLNFS